MQFLPCGLGAFEISVSVLGGSEYNPDAAAAANCSPHPPLSSQRSKGGMEHLHLLIK